MGITVRYRNSFPELIKFNLFHVSRTVVFWLANCGGGIVIGWTLASGVKGLGHSMEVKVVYVTFMTLAVMALLLLLQLAYLCLSYSMHANRGFLTEHTVTLTAEGVREITPLGKQFLSWQGMAAVRENRRYIFIYVSQHVAYVIPKLAFRKPDAAMAFKKHARDRWQRTQQSFARIAKDSNRDGGSSN